MKQRQMLRWEKKAFSEGGTIIIGIDEAGRGPLAGPVVAAACVLAPAPLKKFIFPRYKEKIDDSKKLVPIERDKAFFELSKKTIFGVGLKNHKLIDKRNILNATILAMKEALANLIKEYCRCNKKNEREIKEDIYVLVDGNIKLDIPYRVLPIVRGDSKSLSIAAASIVAKVTRDRIMDLYDKKYPAYGFSRHKGYGTKFHLEAIQKYGSCPIHRKSFAPLKYKLFSTAL